MNEKLIKSEMITSALGTDSKYVSIHIYLSRDRVNEDREEKLTDFEWLIIKSWVKELYADMLSNALTNYVGELFSMIKVDIIDELEEQHVTE